MHWSTKCTEESEDRLHSHEWNFGLMDSRSDIILVVLDWVLFYERKTTRHKYKVVALWARIDTRENNIDKPEIPDAIKEAVRDQIMQAITFK